MKKHLIQRGLTPKALLPLDSAPAHPDCSVLVTEPWQSYQSHVSASKHNSTDTAYEPRGFGSTEEEIQEINASEIASAGSSRPISHWMHQKHQHQRCGVHEKRLEHVYDYLHMYNESSRNADLVSEYLVATTASNRYPLVQHYIFQLHHPVCITQCASPSVHHRFSTVCIADSNKLAKWREWLACSLCCSWCACFSMV